MLKKNCVKVMAAVLSLALLIEAAPAAGVSADEQQVVKKESEQAFIPVEGVTLDYSSVKGFVNGYATVVDADGKTGLIDVTGKEVAACGKYKNIELIEGVEIMLVQDTDDHARLVNYKEETVKDFGECDSTNVYMYEDEKTGEVFATVRIEKNNIYSFYKLDGTLVEEVSGDLGAVTETELSKKLVAAGNYEKVRVLSNEKGAEYCLCTKKDEKGKFYVVDASMNEVYTVDGAYKCDNIYPGTLLVTYEEEIVPEEPKETPEPTNEPAEGEVPPEPEPEYRYTYKLITYAGDEVVGADKGLQSVIYSEENDCILADVDEYEGWVVLNTDGTVKTKVGAYDSISILSGFGGFYLRTENNSYKDDEAVKHFYIVDMKDVRTTDIGEYNDMSVVNYKGKNVIKLIPNIPAKDMKDGVVIAYTPGYKYIDVDGTVVFDSSGYKEQYDVVMTDGSYYYCYKYRKNKYDEINGYSAVAILKEDGKTVLFETDACKSAVVNGDSINVELLNGDVEQYTMDGKFLYTLEKSKYDSIGTVSNGYVPYESKGKWGILKLVDRSALPTPTPTPTAVPTSTAEPTNTPAPSPTFIVYVDNEPDEEEETATPAPVKAPARAKIAKVVSGKKQLTVKLPKVKGTVKGYRVQYSLKKNFKGAKSIVVKKNNVVIKKLKSGKTYYVRAKSYALNGSKKVFSKKWSVVKKGKVK